jgi:arylsulfatase A-like enzyme
MDGKNIVLIVVDTLRVDHLQIGGYHKDTAPFLTSLAKQGVIFANAYSAASWTAPAMASMFTSVYPDHHGVTTGLHFFTKDIDPTGEAEAIGLNRIPEMAITLPEVMQKAGYRTFGIADNPNICNEMGFTRGFDKFDGGSYRGAPKVTAKVHEWSEEILEGDAPFFLYLHYMDPHKPYHLHGATYEDKAASYAAELKVQAALYDTEIKYMDMFFKEVFEGLKLDKNSLVIFVSDHGEEFGEHGGTGHGVRLHEELIRVPLFLVAFDENGTPVFDPQKIRKTTSTIDIMPTLRELLNLPSGELEEGRSLAPFVLNESAPNDGDDRIVFSHRAGVRKGEEVVLHSVVVGRLKLLSSGGGRAATLVDLIEDPGELKDLAAERPEEYARMNQILESHLARPRAVQREFGGDFELSKEGLEELGRLGYLDGEPGPK